MYAALNRTLLNSGGLRPALNLDFTTGVIDPRLTCSGGANGTRVNSAGVIVAATTPRFDYDPVTLAAKGLLVEEARTNKLLNSTIDGASLVTQSVTMTAVAHTLTFYGTGTVTLSGVSTAGPLVGSGAYPARSTLTFTPTAGSLTLTVSGSVQFAQLELGSFATSFIPTAGATVTRTADSVTMTGANFSDWFNASAGTFVASYQLRTVVAAATSAFDVNDGTTNNRIVQRVSTASSAAQLIVRSGAATVVSMGADPATTNIRSLAAAYAVNDFALLVGGGVPVTDTAGAVPVAPTQIRIAHAEGPGEYINGHIRSLRYYNTRLPDATLQALTA